VVRFLLDTNILSEPLRPSPNEGVLLALERHRNALATAAPVWNELVYGLSRLPPSKKKDAIRRYVEEVVGKSLPILPYDAAAAEWHGRERARLEKVGRPPSFVDGQIAAIAKVHSMAVVTRNIDDYALFEGLRLESWFR
jgi:tRNA(fMet)-specific endonuclease VapC